MIAKIGAEHNANIVTSADIRASLRVFLVELIGIEPTTPCLQSRCSPS